MSGRLEQPEVARRVLDFVCGTVQRRGYAPSRESRRVHSAAHNWLNSPTYRGIGIARRYVKEQETSELAVVLYVSRKLSRNALGAAMAPASLRIPGIAGRIPVDVQEIGEVRPAAGGGSGISRSPGDTGTLTCLVRGRDDGVTYLLSCGHVLAASAGKPVADGDPILCPSHRNNGTPQQHTIARYARSLPLDELGGNLGDAALARVTGDVSEAISGAEEISGVGPAPARETVIRLSGASSGAGIEEKVVDPHFRTTLTLLKPNGKWHRFSFVDQVLCTAATKGGDSGAAVFEKNTHRLVGMHLGLTTSGKPPGGRAGGVFSPIQPLLEALRVEPIFDSAAYTPPLPKRFPSPAPATTAPSNPSTLFDDFNTAYDILARTLWGEAEGEGKDGMIAVAWVIRNRVELANPEKWGRSIEQVCTWPNQFECWSNRRDRMMSLRWKTSAELNALEVARAVLLGEIPDPLSGARWFHTTSLTPPDWTRKLTEARTIGRHIFYR